MSNELAPTKYDQWKAALKVVHECEKALIKAQEDYRLALAQLQADALGLELQDK